MNQFLLIIASLVLGFSQGYFCKKRKFERLIKNLKDENEKLLYQLNKTKKVEHLKQYVLDPQIKHDNEFLEQTLVRYINLGESEYTSCSTLYAIIKKINFNEAENVTFFEMNQLMNEYQRWIKNLNDSNKLIIKVKTSNGLQIEKNLSEAIKIVNTFLFNELDIDSYCITYQQLEHSLALVLHEQWKS